MLIYRAAGVPRERIVLLPWRVASRAAAAFLDRRFHRGVPLTGSPTREECGAVGGFIGTIDRKLRSSRRNDVAAVPLMVETNVRELLGGEAAAALPPTGAMQGMLERARPCAIDGRMVTHEWLRASRGLVRVDSLDHQGDPFAASRMRCGMSL
ncbi:MAG TPA: hypothetical protein VG871_18820, partial [Vicinamibacterales bacterium]|nr:hypothetical protein [Vicinamibacterales bacterium]